MKVLKILFFIYVFLKSCFITFGQNIQGNVYGQVVDQQSQITLPGATIVIYSQGKSFGTTSNTNGHFSIKDIPAGRFDIEISFIGYHTRTINNIALSSAKDVFLDIELLERIETLDEVVVKAFSKDKTINEFATISARSFSIEETNKYAGSWGDPARMASNFAGVQSAGDQRNDIVIRGNSPTGLLWRLEGVIIPNPNHFGTFGTTGGPISILNNNQLSNSDFFTSAFPAEYGNAISGVFDLKLRNGNRQNHEFMGQLGFNGYELGAEGPISRKMGSSYMFNCRYTMMDLMNAMGLFDVGGIPQYYDLSFKVFIPTEKFGTFSLFGIGGNSTISLSEDKGSGWTSDMLPGTRVSYGSRMGVIGLTHKYFISNRSRIESSIASSQTNSFNKVDSLSGNEYFNFYNDSYSETKYTVSSKYTLKASAKSSVQVGLAAELYDFDLFDEALDYRTGNFIQSTNSQELSNLYQAFGQIKHRFTDELSINMGIHSQLYAPNNTVMVGPRLGMNYALNSKQSLNLGYGLHGQVQPQLVYYAQTLIDTTGNRYVHTNDNLGFSKSHHYVVGYDYLFTQNLRIKVEAYYQQLFNIPVEQRASYYSTLNYGAQFYNETVDSLVNNGKGRNKGVEFTLEKFLSNNFYFLLTSSIYDSKYQGSDSIWRNTAFNGNYALNFLAGYEIPIKSNALSFNLKVVSAGGKRYVPIDIDKSIEKNETVYNYSNAYEYQHDNYFRIDLRISFKENKKRISQEWSFDVQNLTNHKNILTQRFDAGTGKIANIYQMGFFPIGSWKVYF